MRVRGSADRGGRRALSRRNLPLPGLPEAPGQAGAERLAARSPSAAVRADLQGTYIAAGATRHLTRASRGEGCRHPVILPVDPTRSKGEEDRARRARARARLW